MSQNHAKQACQAGSQSQILIENALKKLESDTKANESSVRLPILQEHFRELLTAHANDILMRQNKPHKFAWDANVESVVDKLYAYATSPTMTRGIALNGKYGCGKTLIMKAYAEMHNNLIVSNEMRIPLYNWAIASDLFVLCAEPSGMSRYSRGPLIIDEFGREEKVGKNFGTAISPVIDLMFKRYESGSPTHITTNFKFETLKESYGAMLGDRFREMFEFVEMKGDSRRK